MSLYDDPYAHYYPLRKYNADRRRGLTNLLFSRWGDTHFDGVHKKWLQWIHDTYVDINDRIQGRLGMSLWDCYIIGSLLSKSHRCLQNRPDHGYIETGTCHGGSAIFAAKALKRLGKKQQTVVTIDIMDGALDPLTYAPVTEEIFWSNVDACGVDASRIKLIVGDSHSHETYKEIQDYKFHMFLLDGDHTYAGTKIDWELYSPLVVQDGYALFHDYKMKAVPRTSETYVNPAWSDYGVKQFVDDNIERKVEWHSYKDAIPANMYVVWRL